MIHIANADELNNLSPTLVPLVMGFQPSVAIENSYWKLDRNNPNIKFYIHKPQRSNVGRYRTALASSIRVDDSMYDVHIFFGPLYTVVDHIIHANQDYHSVQRSKHRTRVYNRLGWRDLDCHINNRFAYHMGNNS